MNTIGSARKEVIREADALRERILYVTLLVGVVFGGLAFVRVLVDAIDERAWAITGAAIVLYAGSIALLLARRAPYRIRGFGLLGLLYGVGFFGLLTAGYLPAPVLILVSMNLLASVLFGRRGTWTAFGLNLVAFLVAGGLLSSGIASLDTAAFFDPNDVVDWLRVTTVFAVFSGIAVISVDVLTHHLDGSLQEQAELVENLKGAMQLHEEAERHRRDAESRLRQAQEIEMLAAQVNAAAHELEEVLKQIAAKASRLSTRELSEAEILATASEIEESARTASNRSQHLRAVAQHGQRPKQGRA